MKHRYTIRIPSFLCRPDDYVGFDGIASLFQEAAWEHAQRLGVDFTEDGSQLYWVLYRLGLHFRRRPRWGETITVTTWPSRIVRLYAMREFVVQTDEGELLLNASSAWVVLDADTGRPVRPERRLSREWAVDEVPLTIPTGKLPTIEHPAELYAASEWNRVRPSDTDRNAHVNNARYIQWLSDQAPSVIDPNLPGAFTFTSETKEGQEYTVIHRNGNQPVEPAVAEPAIAKSGATNPTVANPAAGKTAVANPTVAEVWVKDRDAPLENAVCACRYNPVITES
ncbi:MAG: acyl-[acyl-carrier-protein] thioesterase [Alkalispirochaeta sp.]